jgi:hypothetical protein
MECTNRELLVALRRDLVPAEYSFLLMRRLRADPIERSMTMVRILVK